MDDWEFQVTNREHCEIFFTKQSADYTAVCLSQEVDLADICIEMKPGLWEEKNNNIVLNSGSKTIK